MPLRAPSLRPRARLCLAVAAVAMLVPGSALAGPGDSQIAEIGALGTTAIFGADDGVVGVEPWRSNGSAAGTTLLGDLRTSGQSFPEEFTKAGSYLYFEANDGTGPAVWRTNGTSGGTKNLANPAYLSPRDLTPMGGDLYFTAFTSGEQGEVWRTDGTAAGTKEVTAIGGLDSAVTAGTLVAVGSRLFFDVDTPTGHQLYRSGGTGATTARVKNLPGPATSFTNVAGTLFFVVEDAPDSWSLWTSDGTRNGTVKVKALPGEPGEVVAVGSRLFLSVGSAATGRELWVSNGKAAGTRLVKDIYPGEGNGSEPEGMVAFGTRVAFAAYSHGTTADDYEVWVSDGTPTGTKMLKNINPDGYSDPYGMIVIGGRLWFEADDGVFGMELWSSDGTKAGTKRRTDINPGAGDAFPESITKVGNRVWFVANDGSHGREPWRSTDTGFKLVKDIN